MSYISSFFKKMPAEALSVSADALSRQLAERFGSDFAAALAPDAQFPSPVAREQDTQWMKTANTVGVNIRTIDNFWHMIPYALTLPEAQNTIHLLPVWEPGVVSSLYGPCSWNINPEFYSAELATVFPHLNTVERQLKVVVNILHLLGKAVGMDVVPHTDRYSEPALANPRLFEWLQRDDLTIVRHDSLLYETVQAQIAAWLADAGPAVPGITTPADTAAFFEEMSESDRLLVLFGPVADYAGRLKRRKSLIEKLYRLGFETVPATMGPPYRGIEVDPAPEAKVIDEEGRTWRDYRITRPEPFSRVFGPLARYRLYESIDDNRDWALDFSKPNHAAWAYVGEHYRQIQAEFGFDFMRGDMSHVQMRPEGVPAQPDAYYDLLGAVKQRILPEKPYFGYFAESFLAPPGEMAYGDECDHLEASFADSTLGDLQSEPVGTDKFVRDFAQYRQWLEQRDFAPNFTLMTADKDDPRFDRFYLTGNELRYFIALFMTDMPTYMAMGFECRDPHPEPAPNEHYTKLYVFQMPDGPKGTKGPYQWGSNRALYDNLTRQKEFSAQIGHLIADSKTHWLIRPDILGHAKIIAWSPEKTPEYIFIANFDTTIAADDVIVPLNIRTENAHAIFSTARTDPNAVTISPQGDVILVKKMLPGEGMVVYLRNGI